MHIQNTDIHLIQIHVCCGIICVYIHMNMYTSVYIIIIYIYIYIYWQIDMYNPLEMSPAD